MTYSRKEIMAISAAKAISDTSIVFCGTGIAVIAAMAAKHIYAPRSIIFFETGAIDSQIKEIPLAVGDPRVMCGTSMNTNLIETFSFMQNEKTSNKMIGIIGAAQIDPYGNINSTVIGNYKNPKVRLPGSGGGSDAASLIGNLIIFIKHKRKKFVSKLDYLTSPGWLRGGNERKRSNLSNKGPFLVVTDLGIMCFHHKSKRMMVKEIYPGVTIKEIEKNTGFAIEPSEWTYSSPPTEIELNVLRKICDPDRLVL